MLVPPSPGNRMYFSTGNKALPRSGLLYFAPANSPIKIIKYFKEPITWLFKLFQLVELIIAKILLFNRIRTKIWDFAKKRSSGSFLVKNWTITRETIRLNSFRLLGSNRLHFFPFLAKNRRKTFFFCSF